MASITSAFGASAGIDSLVAQFMALEKRPLNALTAQKTKLNTSISIYTDLNTKLNDLLSITKELSSTDSSSIYNTRSSSSDDTDEVTVSAGTNSASGTYQLRVTQIATGSSLKSSGELITKYSSESSSKVAAGSGTIDISDSFADAGFTNSPDGTVTIGTSSGSATTFTLADYTTVQDFMDAVNADATANANIYYDSTEDKFFIESDDTTTDVYLAESGTHTFFSGVNITAGTGTTYSASSGTGIQANELLYKANFDTTISSGDSGSFKINDVTITWDADTETLDGIINKINTSDANVTAYYDSSLDKVMINSKGTGSSDSITFSDVSGSSVNFIEDVLKFGGQTSSGGQDARFTINSSSAGDEIIKSSNTFTINGNTYTLKKANVTAYTDTTYTTITVKQDTSAIKAKITSFLDKFNAATEYIKMKSAVDISTKTRGFLAGNAAFTNLRRQLISKLSEQITGLDAGKVDYLNEIGITFDSNLRASLSDTAKFDSVIAADSRAVANLFNSTNGAAAKIESLLKPFVESSSETQGSIIDETKNVFSTQITSIDSRIERMNERLALKENNYRQQFFKMQSILNNLVLQGSQITSITNSALAASGTSFF
ncbi:MAG: flagellar filament capping protein FliD [Candidatus Brocadiaceae bacterium]|nr:flagellar filament capping protein FliD [Candidatus Brocadiaceae bacterium]